MPCPQRRGIQLNPAQEALRQARDCTRRPWRHRVSANALITLHNWLLQSRSQFPIKLAYRTKELSLATWVTQITQRDLERATKTLQATLRSLDTEPKSRYIPACVLLVTE